MLLSSFVILHSLACKPLKDPNRLEGYAFGSTYSVTLDESDVIRAGVDRRMLDGAVRDFLNQLESRMNNWRAESEVSQFNRTHTTSPVSISPLTAQALDLSIGAARETMGAFDPTLGTVLRLWGFGPDPFRGTPTEAMLLQARADSGWDKLTLSQSTVQKSNPNVILHLDGMAQGFAVDRTAEFLKARGLRRFLVEIGGEIRAQSGQGIAWTIPVKHPDHEPRLGPLPTLKLADLSVTVSARRNAYVQDGAKRFHHIIDPRTGRPADNGIALAVVVGPETGWADALDTALLVMPPEEGLATMVRLGYDCLLVRPDGSTLQTPGFKRFVVNEPAPRR